MKEILIINGHPYRESFNFALAESYKKGALESGANVNQILISDLKFDPNLRYGYSKRMELEPDLLHAFNLIKKADHIVWVHPVWWGGFPALMKGFIDRLFLPGLTYKPRENTVWWDKLLKRKSTRIITTLDQPGWYYWFAFGKPSVNQLKKCILNFCGIKPVRVSYIGIVKKSTLTQRENWLQNVYIMGLKQK